MLTTALPTIALATALLAPNGSDETPFVEAAKNPPPGTVAIDAGRIRVGSTPKDVTEVLELSKSNHQAVRLLDGETPQYQDSVSAFAIGKYEVTNEQFAAFVRAVDRKPPESWGADALEAAQRAFLEEEGRKMKEAREAGGSYTSKKWDERAKETWWEANWRDVEWAIPAGEEAKPVTFVDYEDVSAYCQWAGLRIPTETEWTAAARGNTTDAFPWGDDWEAKGRAHTIEVNQPALKVVGSMPDGASKAGVHDMAGSVWEWTSSPYNAFPKYKANTYKGKVGKDKFELEVASDFRSNQKVIKGGGYGSPLVAARVAFRQGTMPTQTASELGFRVASSVVPGADLAASVWRETLRHSPARKDDASLDYANISGCDRWATANVAGERPEGYSVISDYDAVVFVPRGDLELKPGGELDKASRVWPVTMGAFITTMPIVEPALEPGSYLVLFRSKGKFIDASGVAVSGVEGEEDAEGEGEDEGEGEEAVDAPLTPEQSVFETIDTKKDVLIFCDAKTGTVVGQIEIDKDKDDKFNKVPADVAFDSREVIVGTGVDRRKETQDWLTFRGRLPFAKGKRAVPLEFAVRLETGTFGTGWRR